MSLSDKKITAYTTSISSLPDKIENNAAWLKAQFDGRTDKEVKDSINGIIDELCGEDAAAQIGAKVPLGLSANGNIQSILYAMREFIDQKLIEVGAGDMQKSIYDTNDNGIVDNAERLCGKTADEFATAEQGENAMPKSGGTFTGAISAPSFSTNTADGSVWLYAGENSSGETIRFRFHAYDGNTLQMHIYKNDTPTKAAITINADGKAYFYGNAETATKATTATNATNTLKIYANTFGSTVYFMPVLNTTLWGWCSNTDNQQALGLSNKRWSTAYLGSAAVVSSDENQKNSIENLTAAKAEKFIKNLKPVTYKYNEGTSNRTHWGLISQDVESAMTAAGLTDLDFAGFIKSPKYEEVETQDENGETVTEQRIVEGEYTYALRYEEFIAPMLAVIKKQSDDIAELKKAVAELQSK